MNDSPSIDPNEAEFFERLAAKWWDAEGPFWPLHRMNTLRTEYVRQVLVREFWPEAHGDCNLKGLRLLDIGCGGGILSESLARMGASVHGVDVVKKNIQAARVHARDSDLDIDYEVASAEILAGRGESYDAVLTMEVVEHVAELPLFLSACMKVVRPGGLLFVATINRTVAAGLGAILVGEYVLKWLPRGTHQWRRFRTPVEIENELVSNGMRIIARTGVGVNPMNHTFHLKSSMAINYIVTARKLPG